MERQQLRGSKLRRQQATTQADKNRQAAREVQRNRRRFGVEDDDSNNIAMRENIEPSKSEKMKSVDLMKRLEEWKKEKEAKKVAQQKQAVSKPIFRTGRVRADDGPLRGRAPIVTKPVKPVEPRKTENEVARTKRTVTSRTDSGLKNPKFSTVAKLNFAETSSRPVIFSGAGKTDKGSQENQRSLTRAVKRPLKGQAGSRAADPGLQKVTLERARLPQEDLRPQRVENESSGNSEPFKTDPAPPMKANMSKTPRKSQPSGAESLQNVSRRITPTSRIPTSAGRATGSSRKRPAEEIEEFLSEETNTSDTLSLGCTPSGKVRRLKSGTPVPVIRKSFELKRLKTAEEKVAALMNSPMVEFRKRPHGPNRKSHGDALSPLTLTDTEKERRNSLSEMRAEVLEKLSADYKKSPLGNIRERLPSRDAESARKLRRKSRHLEEQLITKSECTGKDVVELTAQHFRGLLLDQTTRLTELRSAWESLYANPDIPVHVQAEIAAVVGQTELLFRHKFFFYESMIAQHEGINNSGCAGSALEGRLVTVEDLLGYWELIGIEIENINARYERLEKWRSYGWTGELHDFDKENKKSKAVRPARVKAVPKQKKVVKSKFAEFRAQLARSKKAEAENVTNLMTSDSDNAVKSPPPVASPDTAPAPQLRSALKSDRREARQVGAVRFAADEENDRTPPVVSSERRRPLTPYRARRVSRQSASSFGGEFAQPAPQVRKQSRSRTNSSNSAMPSSPRTPPPSSPDSIHNRPKTGTPFPASPQHSGSRRRIADIRTSAGLTLRTAEASRRKSKSCSPPPTTGVRFVDGSSPDPDSESQTMPVTPFNQSSLVPLPRRSRASNSAPRQDRVKRDDERSNSGSRVRFDSTASSPPATDSAPVTPYNKSSLVPLPRRSRKSALERESPGEVFVQSITPPLTPRLIDVTPLRRSARLGSRREEEFEGDVSLL